jgi:hypothetical protein
MSKPSDKELDEMVRTTLPRLDQNSPLAQHLASYKNARDAVQTAREQAVKPHADRLKMNFAPIPRIPKPRQRLCQRERPPSDISRIDYLHWQNSQRREAR